MNIVYCIPAMYNPGGMERILTEKANYLVSHFNYKITIITTEQSGRPFQYDLDTRIQKVDFGINFNSHFSENLLKKFYLHSQKMKEYKRRLQSYLKENNVDVCISLCGKEIDFLGKLKDRSRKIAEIHFAMDFRKQFLLSRHSGLVWKMIGNFRTWQLRHAIRKMDKLVVLTKQDGNRWQQFDIHPIVISNFPFFTTSKISNCKSKTVVSIGKLDAQKGYDFLIESWKYVNLKHPDWILEIWGQGEWNNKLTNRIHELNLDENIFLKGTTKDVVSAYLNSSIYVMTSRYEGFPLVLIEAMSCGLPIISFDCECGPRELIRDSQNGYLIPVGNIELLANKICELIEDENKRVIMGKNSKEISLEYNLDSIMKKWDSLFHNKL